MVVGFEWSVGMGMDMKTMMRNGGIGWWLWFGVALCSTGAWAGPDEDFKTGLLAWQRGDVAGAMAVLRGPADAGHAPSQTLLGDILDKSEFNEEAVVYLRKAAEQKHYEGMYLLAIMYASGEGTPKDNAEALRLLDAAAAAGNISAITTLAEAYLDGGLGLDKAARESPAALAAVNKAATIKHQASLKALYDAYKTGRWGLTPDPVKAEEYRKQVVSLNPKPQTGKRKGR